MKYFKTKYGTIINESNVVIPMQEGNELYNGYVSYLQNDGELFETDFLTDTDLAIERVEILPQEVQLWRVRTILKLSGLESNIETALNGLDEPMKTGALYVWNYGTTIERQSATVQLLQYVLGLTDTQVDDIFIQANGIQI
jgi:hypothetical protein